ncbi:DNA gyrase inhibitor YacG [Corallococcus carmarthensis]|uniref:DNA gyrase inhibitor YacG n=1 Tax=Corallococcus carmarthensis TaxID=2316728 RepID=A0A3A8KFV6_9BACT|nr:DNA gyrase inhibitor YacG [Corallococcus carmarthensis]RKH07068.1 DNA gyrase inhibitor YacG [Corallococcus carmarthensis]
MPLTPCPICQKPVPPRPENTSQPFCSRRCRAVDLGRWLGEEYRMPDRQAEQQEDELPPDGETRRHDA